MDFNVNMINPFLKAAVDTYQIIGGETLTVGKPFLRNLEFTTQDVLITIGVTGDFKGQVIFCIEEPNAKLIASKMMMGTPVNELDDMSISAISELGNMMMGSASTIFSTQGIFIDITPPMLQRGMHHLGPNVPANICVPLLMNGQPYIFVNCVMKQKNE